MFSTWQRCPDGDRWLACCIVLFAVLPELVLLKCDLRTAMNTEMIPIVPQRSRDRRVAIAALVAINAMWGCSFPIVKTLNLEIDEHFAVTSLTASNGLRVASAAWILAIRFALAFFLFVVFFRGTMRQVRMPHVWAGAVMGTAFFIGIMLQVIGLATIPASRSGFLTSLVVIFAPILQSLMSRRPPRLAVVAGAILALFGASVLTGSVIIDGRGVTIAEDALAKWTLGDTLTTLSALFFSVQVLLVDRFGQRYDSIGLTPSMFAITAILGLAVFGVVQPAVPEAANSAGWIALLVQPRFIGLIIFLSVFASLLAFAWMNQYQPYVTAGQAAVIYTLEPLFASSWAMVLPGLLSAYCLVAYTNESLTLPLFIGGCLVMIANVIALWPERRETDDSSEIGSQDALQDDQGSRGN
jgi:drug/metabolite transporter (DMT)-like permease